MWQSTPEDVKFAVTSRLQTKSTELHCKTEESRFHGQSTRKTGWCSFTKDFQYFCPNQLFLRNHTEGMGRLQPITSNTRCPAEAKPRAPVSRAQAEIVDDQLLIHTPTHAATLTYNQHSTATRVNLPNPSKWIQVPLGSILHRSHLAVHCLSSKEDQSELEIPSSPRDHHHTLDPGMELRIDKGGSQLSDRLPCPLKTCTDVLKELGATEKQLKDLEIRLAKSEAQIEEIKKEKQAQIEEIKKEKQDIVSWTRKGFLQYSRLLTADPNTVNKNLLLSEENRVITSAGTPQSYPDHPDRFDQWSQVLCGESVSDRRSYWEVEWSGNGVYISVSYKSIIRKGGNADSGFGTNDQSWSLICFSHSYKFVHNKINTDLPVKPIISRTVNDVNHYRVGVYVDHSAGTLSFYSVYRDTMILIHTVQTTFTQPLYPGFLITLKGSIKL
ncbi:E3 ubiquitin/ISG15 ligase TRIM25-like [Chanodichthys erythropterus]|uniref:E3 ubiquitin/ISG15 ligase TRIM25-like n=1 Tax=Chanodichthys erythropterus TaxID=933992 RepID=UPI00351E2B18